MEEKSKLTLDTLAQEQETNQITQAGLLLQGRVTSHTWHLPGKSDHSPFQPHPHCPVSSFWQNLMAGWPGTLRDSPAFAFLEQGWKMWTRQLSSYHWYFFKLKLKVWLLKQPGLRTANGQESKVSRRHSHFRGGRPTRWNTHTHTGWGRLRLGDTVKDSCRIENCACLWSISGLRARVLSSFLDLPLARRHQIGWWDEMLLPEQVIASCNAFHRGGEGWGPVWVNLPAAREKGGRKKINWPAGHPFLQLGWADYGHSYVTVCFLTRDEPTVSSMLVQLCF